ncbi:MAG: DUF503 domain-containing protein [Acidimicrobiia bacterium]
MHAAAIRIELRLSDVHSLKGKRAILRPVIRRLRAMELSVSEVDHQDTWQRATLGVAVVAPQAGRLDEVVATVQRSLLEDPTIEVIEMDVTHMEVP